MTHSVMRSLLAAALCAAAVPAVASDLRVCIDKTSDSAMMDRRIAQSVAGISGNHLVVHEFKGDGGGDDEGFPLKNFVRLAAKSCDLVLGFPMDATRPDALAGLSATPAYAHMGFVLVEPRGMTERDLADFPKGTDVGVTYLTTPNLYFVAHPNVIANVFDTERQTIASLVTHQVRAALLWRPTLVHYEITHPGGEKFTVRELTEPHARYDIVALYAARGQGTAAEFDRAIGQLARDGRLTKLVAPFALPGPAMAAGITGGQRHAERVNQTDRIIVVAAEGDTDQTLPALYTAAQAQAGHDAFESNCSMCHGKDLTGIAGPALKGKNFASVKAHFHVSDVFRIVSTNMPATQPGTLSHQEYTEIMAFLLQQNGYPAGNAPLTYEGALKSMTPLLYHGS